MTPAEDDILELCYTVAPLWDLLSQDWYKTPLAVLNLNNRLYIWFKCNFLFKRDDAGTNYLIFIYVTKAKLH